MLAHTSLDEKITKLEAEIESYTRLVSGSTPEIWVSILQTITARTGTLNRLLDMKKESESAGNDEFLAV